MMTKIERLIDEATAFLVEARLELAKKNGTPVQPSLPTKSEEAEPQKKQRRIRAVKDDPPVSQQEVSLPFGPPTAPIVSKAEEDAEKTKLRCIEVMGAFIRQNLKATPSGLAQAQNICNEVCGRVVPKLDSLTHEENLRLIPVFEEKLKKEVLVS